MEERYVRLRELHPWLNSSSTDTSHSCTLDLGFPSEDSPLAKNIGSISPKLEIPLTPESDSCTLDIGFQYEFPSLPFSDLPPTENIGSSPSLVERVVSEIPLTPESDSCTLDIGFQYEFPSLPFSDLPPGKNFGSSLSLADYLVAETPFTAAHECASSSMEVCSTSEHAFGAKFSGGTLDLLYLFLALIESLRPKISKKKQAALKLLAGYELELLQIIPILLGCSSEDAKEGNFIKVSCVQNLLPLMTETAFSHLMEVILEVSPATIYDELMTKIFKGSLLKMSSHHCGNFVVQALISHARSEVHLELIWEELGTKLKDLFGMGRSGVVASLVAASHKLHSHEHKCCQALAAAVCLENDPPRCIVPRILFLDNYFCCKDKPNWNWPSGARVHLMGSLILQSIFRFPSGFIHAYISSITSLEPDNVLQVSKDSGGARVIEAFLSSNASGKQKRNLVVKLRGHFGELSIHPSGSFTVEKCFSVSNVSLRETIVSELLAVQTDLSKTRQGPYLLRSLDVEGYARRPDQWKSRQTSKESTFKDYFATFGPKEPKPMRNDIFLKDSRPKTQQEKLKDMRKEIDTHLASALPAASSSKKRHQERAERSTDNASKNKRKKQKVIG